MKINYYTIPGSGIKKAVDLRDDPELLFNDPEIAGKFFSFTTLRAHNDGKLYLGTTNMKNRILWSFDPETKSFEDLGYSTKGTDYDIKIHRSLEYDPLKKVFYGVSSGLHSEKEYFKAPGAEIFTYDIKSKEIEFLGIPVKHEYTQTIKFDPERRLLYGFTYHTFSFYVFDVDKRETVFKAMPGSISHISDIDDSGCIWSTWGRNQHYIFKFDPEKMDIEWTKKKFPEGGASYMYPGAGPIDCMLNGKDGFLYVALETGSLIKMDPKSMKFEYLGRPSLFPRMPALIMDENGLFYGTCGDDWNVEVFTFDRETRGFKIIAKLMSDDVRCFRPHDIAVIDNKLYVGETDNPQRTGYLWEVIV